MNDINKPFWLKDMIVLGRGAPNETNRLHGAQGSCACIWSESTGYCRIYPVPYGFFSDWDIIDVEVIKPNDDGRENTWHVYNYLKDWGKMYVHIKVHKEGGKHRCLTRDEWIGLVKKLGIDTFSLIRGNRRSFGIIHPNKIEPFLKQQKEKAVKQFLLSDLDHFIMNQKDYKWIPCLKYWCSGNCESKHPHKSKIVEWGCYQWLRKDPNNKEHCEKVFDNLNINNNDFENYLLIGNIRQYPKTYVIVKVIRFKKEPNQAIKERANKKL